ncbi:aldehyde ferredoxin oxidoreductase C-terminal domain-containing protein [Haladaptatus caseinilyticus]|uniref:aldehyde ferredoxin oxidoreductase C-terminal domain-containing protein n=1 Tax=Haladaptatus caseinilyticus TaxID=2993314 RepID=UPI00224B5A45|nr:aldehyde ferredoxin oxidoreductase C-terminal domain-containing protein [Haladaptatus caseinilyticus]
MLHAKGSLLTIDVSDRSTSTTNIEDVLAQFMGGRGVATILAHDRIPFDAEPLGPKNRAYISAGPLQQSQMSFTGRMNMTGLSPLTDGLLSTNAGGYLSRNFVGSGHSVVEITGASDKLLAIHITDEGVEFEEVPDLAQATVPEVTDAMNERHELESENLVTIGPAGENLVRFACPITYNTRAFGRGGLGAVLGSKNVKTVSFRGDSTPPVEIDEDVQSELHKEAATTDDMMKRQGTTAGTEFINDNFSLPTRYFSEQSFEHVEEIGGNAVEEKKFTKEACSVCAFACKLPTRDEERDIETEGPEFETVFSFGSNCGIGAIVDVMQSNKLCDIYGMDTISCGNSVAAYLAAHDEFGNAERVHELVEKIAYRNDEGDLLAEGVNRAHDELDVKNFTVKGMEFAAHDGRAIHGQGLSYAVANRGADHMYSTMLGLEYDGEINPDGTAGKAEVLIEQENHHAIRDSGIFCAFSGDYFTEEQKETILRADYEELLTVGSRVIELERHFNNQRGIDADEDRLPYELPDLQESIQEYYELRGWNDDGTVPESNVDGFVTADD